MIVRKSKIKLAIGLPCTNSNPDIRFQDSFTFMDKPFDWVYLRPTFPQDFPAALSDVRNEIIRQAFECDCTHVLMMDTDQIYPPDTITRLFAHGKHIVRARVHRRYPPFDPIMLRKGENGRYEMLLDAEWLKGGLIEVDATGVAACGLFDLAVFADIREG